MKTKTAFFAAVAAIGLTAQGAGLWDVSVADFPRAAGDGGDSARIMRAVDAAGTKGVVMFPRGEYEIDQMLVVSNGVSLMMHKSARLKAVREMPYVVKYLAGLHEPGCGWGDDRSIFVSGGEIDGRGLANCMNVMGVKHIYCGRLEVPSGTFECRVDLGVVRDWATVYVDGCKVADLWCEPYVCDIMPYVKPGGSAEIRVEVVSTWYNALVHDASLPEAERTTWTKNGPKADTPYHDAGLLGPVKFFFKTNDKDKCVTRFL